MLGARHLREVQSVGRGAVERRRPRLEEPADRHPRLARDARAEGEAAGAQPLAAGERPPAAEVETEERREEEGIARPEAHPPQDPGVGVRDAPPVVQADRERGRLARRARRPVDPGDLGALDAQVAAERRMLSLFPPQVGLGHHRETAQVFKRPQMVGMHAGGGPAVAVEGGPLPRPARDRLQPAHDEGLALRGGHGLARGTPVPLARLGQVVVVVRGRPGLSVIHCPPPGLRPAPRPVPPALAGSTRRSRRSSRPDRRRPPRPAPAAFPGRRAG